MASLARHAQSTAKTRRCLESTPVAERKIRRKRPGKVNKRRFRHALKGTGGMISEIAERLGVVRGTVANALRREGWEDIAAEYQAEVERVGDLAEDYLVQTIIDGKDPALASQNARFLLSRKFRKRGYGQDKHVTVDGGKPIEVHGVVLDIDRLGLSLGMRKRLLKAIEAREQNEEAPIIDVSAEEVQEITGRVEAEA